LKETEQLFFSCCKKVSVFLHPSGALKKAHISIVAENSQQIGTASLFDAKVLDHFKFAEYPG